MANFQAYEEQQPSSISTFPHTPHSGWLVLWFFSHLMPWSSSSLALLLLIFITHEVTFMLLMTTTAASTHVLTPKTKPSRYQSITGSSRGSTVLKQQKIAIPCRMWGEIFFQFRFTHKWPFWCPVIYKARTWSCYKTWSMSPKLPGMSCDVNPLGRLHNAFLTWPFIHAPLGIFIYIPSSI